MKSTEPRSAFSSDGFLAGSVDRFNWRATQSSACVNIPGKSFTDPAELVGRPLWLEI
jgi:hypothetical protein